MVIEVHRQPDDVAPGQPLAVKVPVKRFFYRICIKRQPVAAEGVAAVCSYQRGATPGERVFRVAVGEDVDVKAFDVQGFEDGVHENLPKKKQEIPRREISRKGG